MKKSLTLAMIAFAVTVIPGCAESVIHSDCVDTHTSDARPLHHEVSPN
jgi:AhpD family alkylhydroperoxidase